MRYLRTNTDTRITVGPFLQLDKTDGITPEVALTVTSEKLTFVVDTAGVPTLVLDAAPTASGGANDMVHITGDDSGYYDLELAAANVNYLGRATLSLNDVATHLPVFHEFMILPAVIYDAMVLGTDLFDVSVTQLLGTAWLTPGVAGTPDVNAKQIGGTAQTGGDVVAAVITNAAGTDIAADIIALKAETVEILADTAVIGALGAGLTGIPWNSNWDAEVQSEVYDALDAAFTDATGLTANGLLDRIRTLGWIQRNKIAVTDATGTTIIYKDNSTTEAFNVVGMLTDDSTTTIRLRAA